MRIKVQFALNETPICMSGTVRSVDYKEASQRSLLHVESDPLPRYAQNVILGEVFGMQGSGEEDLPYRISNEAVEEMAGADTAEGAETGSDRPVTRDPGPDRISAHPGPSMDAFAPSALPPVFTLPDAGTSRNGDMPMAAGAEGMVPMTGAPSDEPPLIPFPPEGDIL
jgi:hypothetical protein